MKSCIVDASQPQFKQGERINVTPHTTQLYPNSTPLSTISCDAQANHPAVTQKPTRAQLEPFLDITWFENQDTLAYFHEAHTNHLIHIDVQDTTNQVIELTLHASEPLISTLCIHAHQNSHAHIILRRTGHAYTSSAVRVLAEEDSTVRITTTQRLAKKCFLVQEQHARVHARASVHWVDLTTGHHDTRSHISCHLNGDHAQGSITDLSIGGGHQRLDLSTRIHHNAPHTSSCILTKSVSQDHAHVLSRSLININRDAHHATGNEQQKALILDKNARADAIPKLEISNNKVQCRHGSSVGRIDEEQLFYMTSRGLPRKEAMNHIIEGFFTDALARIENPDIQNRIRQDIREVLS